MNDQFGLSEEVVNKISEIFKKYSQIKKVLIYGSRAIGNFKTGSDIDLTIDGEDFTTTDLLKVENELDDLLLPYKFDLSLLHQIDNLELKEHISKVGKIFYSSY